LVVVVVVVALSCWLQEGRGGGGGGDVGDLSRPSRICAMEVVEMAVVVPVLVVGYG
jgi:hypothetical protein